ncbi:MAG: ABC transporter permease, partial [Chromohalobacter japonicus]
WRAIQRLRPGDGFEAGIAVVILAMLLDRITQALRKPKKKTS